MRSLTVGFSTSAISIGRHLYVRHLRSFPGCGSSAVGRSGWSTKRKLPTAGVGRTLFFGTVACAAPATVNPAGQRTAQAARADRSRVSVLDDQAGRSLARDLERAQAATLTHHRPGGPCLVKGGVPEDHLD